MLWIISEHFGYGGAKVKPMIPAIPAAQFFQGQQSVNIRCPEFEDGNVSLLELLTLANLVKEERPRSVLEIGTFNGRTSLNLAANCGKDTKIYTLDLPLESIGKAELPLLTDEISAVGKRKSNLVFRGSDCESKIVRLYGDSAAFNFSELGEIDFAFIDGSHSYEYVMNDTEKALSIVSQNGTIVWHDYTAWDDVTRALNELYVSGRLKSLQHIAGTTLVCMKRTAQPALKSMSAK